MNDPLARRVLPHGTIDLGVGEARVVRESLLRYHPEDLFRFADDPNVWDYQQPNGYPPLVRALEDFYGHPVVVTCGAKQGLSAVFYALRKRGKVSCGLEIPYWSQLPAAIRLSGLNVALGDPRDPSFDSYLHVSPNNPDGHLRSWRESNELYMSLKARGIPFIHDAAYYTDIYINDLLHQRGALGDVQIYSVSKQTGMSGMRLGYVVCSDHSFYNDIMDYIETTTVGASAPPQRIFYEIICREHDDPALRTNFVISARQALTEAREVAMTLHPDVLEVPADFLDHNGMFGWFKKGPKFRPDAARVHVIDGLTFGDSSKVRINLAVGKTTLQEAITRLHVAAGVHT